VDEDVLRQLRTYFEAHPAGLAAVYLYGSIARGDAHAGSDVDVGVLFAGDPPSTFVAQPYELEAALEDRIRRPVQVSSSIARRSICARGFFVTVKSSSSRTAPVASGSRCRPGTKPRSRADPATVSDAAMTDPDLITKKLA
jgi:predicted nucleotidyltransferase